jgi:ABC-2 type transport system permease protein
VSVRVASWPLLVAVVLLASLTSGALGLALGTIVRPQQIGLMFALVVVPITFLGCVYYPWAMLHPVRWLQILVLANPLVYMSEGLRAALTPDLPHMPVWAFLGALTTATLLLGTVGVRAFVRRTIS